MQTQDQLFSLVTLDAPCGSDRYFIRHVFRTYQQFSRRFRIIDIREYQVSDNPAEVTILDRFAVFAAMFYDGVTYEDLRRRLAGTKNLVFMTSDLHYWSIFPELITPEITNSELTPSVNNYDRLFEIFDQLDIRHLITSYECPELKQIQLLRPSLATYVIDLHVDTQIFRDYGLPKAYDVIIYGALQPGVYPFRRRVADLLVGSKQFRILNIELKTGLYREWYCGKGLARRINKSRLGLATVSNFSYLVGRYFEIPACRTVVLGNMNEQGRAIFQDHYLHIDDEMTDAQILTRIGDALADVSWLEEQADHMYAVMQTQFTLSENERKLFELAEQIRQNDRRTVHQHDGSPHLSATTEL